MLLIRQQHKTGGISMKTTPTTNSVTDSVHQAHKARIEAARNTVIDNHVIEQIKEYANTKISEDDAGRVRCSTFEDFDIICRYIATKEHVQHSKVYPALRLIGYNHLYHRSKLGDPDILEDRFKYVSSGITTLNRNVVSAVANDLTMFNKTDKTTYRIEKKYIAIALKDSARYGVSTADLNLYHALCGAKILTETSPDYILLRENEFFVVVNTMLDRVESSIKWSNDLMEKVLNDV
jgi:hypothetical protein